MLYRNVVTGAEFESTSIISAPDWITVGAEVPPTEKKEEKKVEAKKPAPKKSTKRTKK